MPRVVAAPLSVLCLVGLATTDARAHATGASYLHVATQRADPRIAVTWDIAVADLQLPLGLDADGDGLITRREIGARPAAIAQFATDRLAIRRGGADCRLTSRGLATTRRGAETFVSLALDGRCVRPGPIEVRTALFFGSPGYSLLLDAHTTDRRFAAALTLANAVWYEPRAASWRATIVRFVRAGVWHVLIGYDHVAFLLLLMLPSVLRGSTAGWTVASSRREVILDLARIVTAFTVAHSITLGLAAVGTVRVPAQPIEVAIAGSIVIAGLLNLFPAAAGWRLQLAAGFGLVHGFGFANALQESTGDGLRIAPMLAGFNLGVELAQLALVAAVVPVLWRLSRSAGYPRRLMPALSVATAMTGAIWFAGRL